MQFSNANANARTHGRYQCHSTAGHSTRQHGCRQMVSRGTLGIYTNYSMLWTMMIYGEWNDNAKRNTYNDEEMLWMDFWDWTWDERTRPHARTHKDTSWIHECNENGIENICHNKFVVAVSLRFVGSLVSSLLVEVGGCCRLSHSIIFVTPTKRCNATVHMLFFSSFYFLFFFLFAPFASSLAVW